MQPHLFFFSTVTRRISIFACMFLIFTNVLQAQWVQTNGPYGGVIIDIAVCPNGTGGTNLFAGTNGSGVFRSINNGTSWTESGSGLTKGTNYFIVVSGENLFAGSPNDGMGSVYISTNYGTSWTAANSGLPRSMSVTSLAVSGTNLFVGTDGFGVYLSTNNGTSWTAVSSGLPTNTEVRSMAVSGTNIFAGLNGEGVYLSTNNGTSWTSVNSGLPQAMYVTSLVVSSNGTGGTNIFAGNAANGVFLSTDSGTSWTEIGLANEWITSLAVSGKNIFAGSNTSGGIFLSTDNGASWTASNSGLPRPVSVTSLAVSGTNLFAGTNGSGVYLSTNNGTSWTEVNTGLSGTYLLSLAVSGANTFAGTYLSGVYVSTNNGISWTPINSELMLTFVYSLAVSGTNLYAGTGGGGVFLSTDNGTSWTPINSGISRNITCLIVNGENLFVGDAGANGNNPRVFLSTNNGTNWVEFSSGLPSSAYVLSIAVSGENVIAGTNVGLFRSTINTSWTEVNSGGLLTNKSVRSLAVSGTSLFAGIGGGVFRSTDNGLNWTQVNSSNCDALAVFGSNIFEGEENGVFLSTNNGTSWTDISNGLPVGDPIKSLATSGTNIFARTLGRVWKRPLAELIVPVELTDFSANLNNDNVSLEWSTATETNNKGFEIQRKSSTSDFVTVTFVNGKGTSTQTNNYSWTEKLQPGSYSYRLKQFDYDGKSEYSKIVEVTVNPHRFSLEQNYPNPFNPNTTFSYSLPARSRVHISIYNQLGEKIAVLLDSDKEAGYYSIEWNAGNMASGVYFYELKTEKFRAVKKLLLMK